MNSKSKPKLVRACGLVPPTRPEQDSHVGASARGHILRGLQFPTHQLPNLRGKWGRRDSLDPEVSTE